MSVCETDRETERGVLEYIHCMLYIQSVIDVSCMMLLCLGAHVQRSIL